MYHPIVAAAGETGDILDLRLREGQVHTADGGLEFVLEVLERAERHLCGKAAVRFDAGYPGEPLMAALEERGTRYVARVQQQRRAEAAGAAGHGRRGLGCVEQRARRRAPHLVCESSYRAGSWYRSRRVVQVVVERPGELIPRCFWLLASMPSGEMSGEDLLALYRKRGKADGCHLGELMSVVAPGPVVEESSTQEAVPAQGDQQLRESWTISATCSIRCDFSNRRGIGFSISMHVQLIVLERVTRHRLEPAATLSELR